MMPDMAERIGIPRAVGVEFPFGHPYGHPDDDEEHRTILGAALDLLDEADEPGTIRHLDLEWPNPDGDWHKRWHPAEAAPVIKALLGRD